MPGVSSRLRHLLLAHLMPRRLRRLRLAIIPLRLEVLNIRVQLLCVFLQILNVLLVFHLYIKIVEILAILVRRCPLCLLLVL